MARKLVSNPSSSVFVVNAPEVKDFNTSFVYNYYEKNERITENAVKDKMNGEYSRYVRLSWKKPATPSSTLRTFKPKTIKEVASKIISEDNSIFNSLYISHTFSDISAIETGLTSFKSFSRINGTSLKSVSRMASDALKNVYSTAINLDTNDDTKVDGSDVSPSVSLTALQMYENYLNGIVSSLPTTALGLRVFDKSGNLLSDEGEFFRNIIKDSSLPMKIRTSILPDVFSSGVVRKDSTYQTLSLQYEAAKKDNSSNDERSIYIDPVNTLPINEQIAISDPQVRLIGYIIDKFLVTNQGFVKKDSIYIESVDTKEYIDTKVAYGQVYIYNIKSVVSARIVATNSSNSNLSFATCYVSSRAEASSIKCFEYKPPPPPEEIKFHFNSLDRKLTITWDIPVNHQRDIKQFQVLRRRLVGHPFELIKVISFDDSAPGSPDNLKYRTGEIVDGNKPIDEVSENLRDHVKSLIVDKTTGDRYIPYIYKDNDFTVDQDYTMSDDFIYALCSVDAHGMISNYSEQYRVNVDVTTRRLSVERISDSGAPRQYPNMMILTDTFKDALNLSGSDKRKLTVFFNPEYLKVKKGKNDLDVVETYQSSTDPDKPFYTLQFINLDNQKMQEIKIQIQKDS